ncbi:MAG: ice-binding family protein [Pseudomonadota bacterium]
MLAKLLIGPRVCRAPLATWFALGALFVAACSDQDALVTPPDVAGAGAIADAGAAGDVVSASGGGSSGSAGIHAGAGGIAGAHAGGATAEAGAAGAAGDRALAQAPTVLSTSPADGSSHVPSGAQISAVFSEPMAESTLNEATFVLRQGSDPITGTVSFDRASNTATFVPHGSLALGLPYTATISTGAEDATGQSLASDFSWSFATTACEQMPVTLGAAANFVVLAGSTVTSTGLSALTGDLGVSPGTAVTGFPPGVVVGAKHAGDATSALGMADLTTAYNSAKGRTLCPVSVSGNLGGKTLAPGLYKSTTSLAVSSGDLTLDAEGDGDAIFIFQMASTLTTTAGRQVILSNGAKASNVFWQVGTSATIGTTSVFQGTIMADQAITLKTGAELNGRALARIAAVDLDSNQIVKPAL